MPHDHTTDVMALSDILGVKLEITRGLPTWEAFPGMRHQKAVRRILLSIAPIADHPVGCGCFAVADVSITFPDGSFKRPDIALYCHEPADTDAATTELPNAVIEVISNDSERKDLEINPPFYLAHGIQDVVIVDPRTLAVTHHRHDRVQRGVSPMLIHLICGCQVTV